MAAAEVEIHQDSHQAYPFEGLAPAGE